MKKDLSQIRQEAIDARMAYLEALAGDAESDYDAFYDKVNKASQLANAAETIYVNVLSRQLKKS